MNCDRHPQNPQWWGDHRRCFGCAQDNYAQDMIDRDRGKGLPDRAFGTGLGSDAAAEARESKRYDKEYQDSKTHAHVRKYL